MCEPTALAIGSFALQAGSALAQHEGEARQSRATRAAATEAAQLQVADISKRQQEELRAGREQEEQVRREGREVAAMARASASEAGVQGTSVDLLLDDIEGDTLGAQQSLRDSTTVSIDQLQRMKLGVNAERDNRIAAAPEPSGLLTGLRIGSAGIGLGNQLYGRRPA